MVETLLIVAGVLLAIFLVEIPFLCWCDAHEVNPVAWLERYVDFWDRRFHE